MTGRREMGDPRKEETRAGSLREEDVEVVETGGEEIVSHRVEAGPSPERGPADELADEVVPATRETRARTKAVGAKPGGEAVTAEAGAEGAEPAAVQAELAEKSARLEEQAARAQEYLDTAQRLKAEFENFKKRMIREQTQMAELAAQAMVEKLLPILDNFERAVYMGEHTGEAEPLLRGVEMVYAELRDVLEREGLREVEAQGKPFDPELHEAVIQVEAGDGPDNVVVDVLRKGYLLKGRLVRPAMVKIAKK